MARVFLTPINLSQLELQNAVIQNLGSPPGSPVKGQMYFNSGDNTLYWWNGTAWIAAKDAGASSVYYQTMRDGGTNRAQRNALNFVDTAGNTITVTDDSGADESEISVDTVFAAVTAQTTFGLASGNGSAATSARSDHVHGTPTHDSAAHSSIPLSALAVPTTNLNLGNFKITNLGAPTAASDGATMGYVDSRVAGLSWKNACDIATTANITLSGSAQTIDGASASVGKRILVKNQTNLAENGVYDVAAGAWARSSDMDASAEFPGATVMVKEGTVNADTGWTCSNDAGFVLGANVFWVQFSGGQTVTAGSGLTQSGNTVNVVAGDTSLTVAADSIVVNTSVIATAASVATKANSAVVLTAGAGIAGGGDLSTNRSFDIGAGTGITVAADSVGLDTTYTDGRYARKVSAGNAAAATTSVTHNWGTRDVTVEVYRNATPWDTVEVDIERTDTNNVLVRFASAPAANAFRIVVTG